MRRRLSYPPPREVVPSTKEVRRENNKLASVTFRTQRSWSTLVIQPRAGGCLDGLGDLGKQCSASIEVRGRPATQAGCRGPQPAAHSVYRLGSTG
jgi:hypothetical protein